MSGPDRRTRGEDGVFGLRSALGEDGTAELMRRQRRTARAYGEHAAAERATAWLVANGYEEATPPAPECGGCESPLCPTHGRLR